MFPIVSIGRYYQYYIDVPYVKKYTILANNKALNTVI